jgi:hypothetical protein
MRTKNGLLALGLTSLVLGAFLCGMAVVSAQENESRNDQAEPKGKGEETPDRLQVRQLELVNADGVVVARMGTDDHGYPSLVLMGNDGKAARAKLRVTAEDSVVLELADPKGAPVVILFGGLDGPTGKKQDGLNLFSRDGAVLAELWAEGNEPGLAFRDAAGVIRSGMGVAAGQSGLLLCDEEGEPRIVLETKRKGASRIEIKADGGESVHKWTSDD